MGKLIWKENGKTHIRNFSGLCHQDRYGKASVMSEEVCREITLLITTGESHEKATPLHWIQGQAVSNLADNSSKATISVQMETFGRIIDWVLGGVATIAILHIAAFIF